MKILLFLVGLASVLLIVYSGYYTVDHPNFVVWFGLITALGAPLAFELILYPFNSTDKNILKNFSKVTQIEALLQQAFESEEKVKNLEKKRSDLEQLIAFESKRRTLIAQREIYVMQGKEALLKIQELNTSLNTLLAEKQEIPVELQPLLEEMERMEATDIVYLLGNETFVLKKKYFDHLPLYGNALYNVIKMGSKISNRVVRKAEF